MTREEDVSRIVIEVIAERLGVPREKVFPEARLIKDLGADSLNSSEVVLALESRFFLGSIPDEEVDRIVTVRDAIECVRRLLGEKAAG